MNSQKITCWGCLFVFSLVAVSAVSADEKPAPKKNPQAKLSVKITVDKLTTHFTAPLDKDGFVDYAGALNAWYSKGVTPETNAMVMLYMAFGPKPDGTAQPDEFFKLMGMKKPPANGKYFQSISHLYSNEVKGNREIWTKFFDEQSRSQRPWKKGELKLVEEWLEANEEPMKTIVKAVQRRHSYSPLVVNKDENGKSLGLIGVLLPGIQYSREFARAFIARAMRHLGEGRTQQAWDDLITIRKLGRLIGKGPTLIEALVGIAIQNISMNGMMHLIERTNPDEKQIAKYIAELDQIENDYPVNRMSQKIDTAERAMYLDCVHLLARGSLKMQELGGLTSDGKFGGLAQKYATGLVEWDLVLRSGNVWYDRMVKVIAIDDFELRNEQIGKIDADLQKIAAKNSDPTNMLRMLDPKNGRKVASEYIGNLMIALLLPAVQQARVAEDRGVQATRYLKIALGLSAYLKANGKYPNQLSELKKYIGDVPGDIFSKQPLTYKVTKDGYLLYSVGPNGKDEKGHSYDDTPRGDDVNIRLPIPVKD